ncbi:4247_t:CDS:2 [Funneliformis geosporum]|uniref:4247_t:CDS:1 n=1 Tax=Funneliformis geosporum TaxID=1117311 RepID=A0A9W4SKF3_9GLOM|nr:4247_t:CDS:2 [Funneliformis geosporum]
MKLQIILHDANLYEDDKFEVELEDKINDIYIPEEILKDLDEFIEDLNMDLEEETNDNNDIRNDTVEADNAEED